MREIKFRVYSHETEIMYDWEELLKMDGFVEYMQLGEGDQTHAPIMQYTGQTDRNGKEIYEGDIVRGATDIFDKLTGMVVHAGASFVIDGIGKYVKIREELLNSYEVIGSVWENPELLKDGSAQ